MTEEAPSQANNGSESGEEKKEEAPVVTHQRSTSVSMRDWNGRRQLSLADMQTMLGMDDDEESKKDNNNVNNHLQTQLDSYNGPNPFIKALPFTIWERIKMILFILSGIVLIKILLFILILFWIYLMSILITCCTCTNGNTGDSNNNNNNNKSGKEKETKNLENSIHSNSSQNGGRNSVASSATAAAADESNNDMKASEKRYNSWIAKPFHFGIWLGMRSLLFFVFGFYWIPINNENDKKDRKKGRIVTPNHCSIADGFFIYIVYGAVPCAKSELRKLPLFGRVADAIGFIWIDRYTREGRKRAVSQVSQVANNPNLPPVLIFPQGTTSNTRTLTQFKAGAFISGNPVQPVALRYTNCFADLTLEENMMFDVLHTMCQFINFIKVDCLKVYYPSEDEKNDAMLFGNNVRKLIATRLGATVTSHTFDDILFRKMASSFDANYEGGLRYIVMDDVYRKLEMKTKTVLKLGKIFLQYADPKTATIDLPTFCKLFGLSDMTFAQSMFDILCGERNSKKDKIMFDDFLVAVAICYQDSFISDARILFFQCCNRENKQQVCGQNVKDTITTIAKKSGIENTNEWIEEKEIERFINHVFGNESDYLTFKQFTKRAKDESDFIQTFLQFVILTRFDLDINEQEDGIKARLTANGSTKPKNNDVNIDTTQAQG